MSLLAAVLVGAAVVLLLRPGRRGGPAQPGRRGVPRRPRRPQRPPEPDLGAVVMEVATRLDAGAPVARAWTEAFARAGIVPDPGVAEEEPGVPAELLLLAARPVRDRRTALRAGRGPGLAPAMAGTLPGALAACRLTREAGAPLAGVLRRCAEGITEAGHAQAARDVALAGPRATARLLGWLPALGLLLGIGVGAEPMAVLLDGGLGSACLVLGAVLILAGRRWVRALERRAGAGEGT